MKLALVYDRVNKIGGAERILTALHEIWPEAPLFTTVYNPSTAPWAESFNIITSFLQKFPLAKNHHEIYPWLAPIAFESFDFTEYDVVISITSAEAKGVLTKPGTLHICYCLTPTRYLWSGYQNYDVSFILRPFVSQLRVWDQTLSNRPDIYIAISQTVAKRIKKYYRKESKVIYPPVDIETWKLPDLLTRANNEKHAKKKTENFYLVVSRLVAYKRIDLAVQAFNKLGYELKIIGRGSEESRLKRLAKSNVEFLGQLTDKEVLRYYQNCRALIFPGEEDFGLVPLEVQACGKPVVAYKGGGATETVIDGKTGIFFYQQTIEALINAIHKFVKVNFKAEDCRIWAGKFSKDIFKKKFKDFINKQWTTYQKNIFMS